LQIFRDEGIEPLFVVVGNKFLNQRMAIGVTDVWEHLPAESALTDGLDALSKCAIVVRCIHPRELASETLQVSEGEFVNDADKAIQLKE
jgi:hypothetical protein